MVVGAGNAYVAEAKRQLFGRVGIDLLAGPTEILVVCDASADPEIVAADVLGQAEHGPTSVAGVIAIGEDVAAAVAAQIDRLLETWPTADVAGESWRDYGWIAAVEDDDAAIALADEVACEHLEIQVARPRPRTSTGCATTARCSWASRRRSRTATRASAPTTSCRRCGRRATRAACGSASSSRPSPGSA